MVERNVFGQMKQCTHLLNDGSPSSAVIESHHIHMRFHDFIGSITIVLANGCFMGVITKVAVDTAIMVIALFRFLAGPVILTPYSIRKPIKLTACDY